MYKKNIEYISSLKSYNTTLYTGDSGKTVSHNLNLKEAELVACSVAAAKSFVSRQTWPAIGKGKLTFGDIVRVLCVCTL